MLFSLGPAERRDAYGIISLYLSYFSCDDRFQEDMVDRAAGFDMGADKEFWGEIKRGLVLYPPPKDCTHTYSFIR